MSDFTPKQRYLNILNGKPVDRISCSCPLQTATMELMDKTDTHWPASHKEPKKMADLAYAAWEYAGLESVRVPFCLTVEAETLGCKIDLENEKSQPSVQEHILMEKENLDNLQVPEPEKDGRMPVVGEAVSMLKEKVGDELPVICGIVSPFTLAGHLRGVEFLLMDTFDDPEFVENVVSFAGDVTAVYGKYLESQGADSICLIDPSATTELIGPDLFASLAAPNIKKVVDSLSTPVVLHICGDTMAILEDMEGTGAKGISIDHIVDTAKAKSILKDAALVGNINPVDSLMFGDQGTVLKNAQACFEGGTDIMAPGCGISPNTPTENILAYTKYTKNL